jgi:hypothetical protein
MTPERTRKTSLENIEALAIVGQLQPGAIYFDSYNSKWYGALSNTEFQDMATGGTPVAETEYTGVGVGYEVGLAPDDGAEISAIFPYSITFFEDAPGSSYYADSGPSSEVVVTFKKNGISFGTLTVAIGATTSGTWDITETEFVSGDRLSFVFPATQDLTWTGVTITIKGLKV